MSDSHEGGWPLSAAQHGIWLGQQLDLQSPVYNAGECIEISGPVDPVLFESAVRRAVREAEVLHARFVSGEEGPRQLLGQEQAWTLHVADFSGAPDPREAAQAWMRRDLARTVDLGRGPLFAEALLKTASDRFFWYQRAHHIALDGYGFSLMARRVSELYTALASGKPATGGFGPLRSVLAEDAAYQAGERVALDRAFWMERFADRPTPVSLANPAPMSSTFVRHTRCLPASDVERLAASASRASLTWPDLVLAATAAWLHRRTHAQEVVLGLPVMSRLGSAAVRVPCMAMNIVPLRVRVRPDAGLFELGRAVASELRAIRPHLRYRYEQLRRDLRLVGGQRRLFGPVVNIMPFDYALNFAGMPAAAHNISAGPVEDLSIGLYARSDGQGLRIDFDANPACYRAEELDTLQRDFLQLLESLLDSPEQPLRQAAASQSASLVLRGEALSGPVRPVLELITEQAAEQPEAIAVDHAGRTLTYRELVQAARALADRLAAENVQPDSPVAVMLPRGIDAIVASLGVMFSGAGYLPMDPLGPSSRNTAILEDAAPALIISAAANTAPGSSEQLLVRRNERAARPTAPAPLKGEQLAYVIYTSGSTGQPNGVQITRDALAHFVAGATQRYGISRDDRVMQFAPLHFDASVEEIFLTLCAGARLVVRTDEMLQSVPRLLEACSERGITVLDLPTAFWHELAYAVSTSAARLPSSLRTVIIGGEAALPERVARWRAAVGSGVQLLNTYGPTEATVVATAATLSDDGETGSSGEEVPIGRPLPGVAAVLIGERGEPVALGAEGELYLMGGALARGYLGRPELDAARFVRLEQLPGSPRAYRTGDKARQREDGQLVFVGRVDDEFKISGHRIDPAEIETVLLGHGAVREAAVVGQVLPSGTRRLCAHVVAAQPTPSAAELRRHLLNALPAPMVPGVFVFAEHLPRTSTGKIDRTGLRLSLPADEAVPAVEAATQLERTVLQVWEQVLGTNVLSAQDDFFELGGQSLQTIQVANRLSVALGREVPVATVFRHPTAAGLAQALEGSGEIGEGSGGLTPAMLADAELPEQIVPRQEAGGARVTRHGSPASMRQVLLTGSHGLRGCASAPPTAAAARNTGRLPGASRQ